MEIKVLNIYSVKSICFSLFLKGDFQIVPKFGHSFAVYVLQLIPGSTFLSYLFVRLFYIN